MKKLLFILFLIASFSMFGQFTFKNGSGTIDVYEYTTLKSSMSKAGLEVTYAGAWLRFVQGGKVINRYKFSDVDTPSYNSIDSLVVTIRGWITSTGGDTNLWAISSGHLYPLRDTVVVGDVASPTSIFEVDSLIKFDLAKENTFLGKEVGVKITSGTQNTIIGYKAGVSLNSGYNNTIFGYKAGYRLTNQTYNTFVGRYSGVNNTGSNNTYIGEGAGQSNSYGNYNVFLGRHSGYSSSSSSYSVFIGYNAGYYETNSNRLYIENTSSSTPLIYGEFDNDFIKINGGFAKDYDIKTADYTIGLGDYTIQEQTASKTITLPSGTKAGQEYGIVNTSSGTITIATDGSDKIGNTGTSTSYSLASGNAVTVRFDGVDRWTLH